MMRLPRKNIIMELIDAHDGVVHLLLHLGNKAALPVDFVHRYCVEASSERLLRLLARCVGRGFYHFRMKVSCFDESAHGVFAWRVEDSFHELRKLGFLLYDDNRGDWTPYSIYQHLLEQGRATAPMPVLQERPGEYVEGVVSPLR